MSLVNVSGVNIVPGLMARMGAGALGGGSDETISFRNE